MKAATVCRIFTISASHRLQQYEGPCRSLHGHNYTIEVYVSGPLQLQGSCEGMVVDFSELSRLFKEQVEAVLDHKHLNDVLLLDSPTAENLAYWIYDRLAPVIASSTRCILSKVRVWETPTSFAEVEVFP